MSADRYNFGDTSYIQEMEKKTTQYDNLTRAASRAKRFHDGKPTAEEADCYLKAAEVCSEIMALNLSNRETHAKWAAFKEQCLSEFDRIAAILNPKPDPVVNNVQKNRQPAAQTGKKAPVAAGPVVADDDGIIIDPKHLCDEVKADMVKGWFRLEKPKHAFEDLVGRAELKEQLIREAANVGWEKTDGVLGINPVQCYFLYGPPGSGKTHMIEAFAKELMDKKFRFMQLDGGDIHASHVGVAEKIIKAAFAVAVDNAPCLIFMDEIDGLCVSKSGKAEGHEKRLTTAYLEAYNKFIKSGKRLIFMGATNYPGAVDDAMLSRTTMIRIPLPDEEERVGYFKRFIDPNHGKKNVEQETGDTPKKVALAVEEGFTAEIMAASTENYSYRDLDKLCESIRIMLKAEAIEKYAKSDDGEELDQAVADEKATEAIVSGKVVITRKMFCRSQEEHPITDSASIRQELMKFEQRMGIANR